MSVAVTFRGTDVTAPVATEMVFENVWQPACEKLGLRWVPLFQGGIWLTGDDCDEVLEELFRLEQHFSKNWTQGESGSPLDRVRLLSNHLRRYVKVEGLSAFVG